MSFGLARHRELDPTGVGIESHELGPLPDNLLTNPHAGRVDPRRWFPEPGSPLEIEVGCGKGTFLLQEAPSRPGTNFLGIEVAREFWLYAADRVRRRGLGNVRVLHADAAEFLRWRAPDAVARVIHVYFPDPWPKTRHHRRRIIQRPLLEQAHRVLEPGGEVRVVTDHAEYWEWMQREFAAVEGGLFERAPFAPPASAGQGEVVGTNFERKYRREGRPFYAAILRRLAPPGPPTGSQGR